MFEGYKRKKMRGIAKKFLESEYASVVLGVFTEAERTILDSVQEQRQAIGLDGDVDALPSKQDRAEQIRQLALAKINDELPQHIVENYHGNMLDHAEEAAEYANLDKDDWLDQKHEWAEKLRDQGATGSDFELAEKFVELRYDVDLNTFYHLVVHWPEGREANEIESVVASGLRTANQSINQTTELLDDADVNLEDVQEA